MHHGEHVQRPRLQSGAQTSFLNSDGPEEGLSGESASGVTLAYSMPQCRQ